MSPGPQPSGSDGAADPEAVDPFPRGVTIGILTMPANRQGLAKLLAHLRPPVERFAHAVEVIVVNNGGVDARAGVEDAIAASGLRGSCPCRHLLGGSSNISAGRNLVLDRAAHRLVAYIDDDEYPDSRWLETLVAAMREGGELLAVAGPVHAVMPGEAPAWVKTVDVHDALVPKRDGRRSIAGCCNVLVDLDAVRAERFDESFGVSGGEDTEFFSRLTARGGRIGWAADAVVHEDVPPAKATSRYMIRRFLSQGAIYRRVLDARGTLGPEWAFSLRAVGIAACSLPIAGVLVLVRSASAGFWMKRAFTNVGKVVAPSRALYR